MRSLTVGEGPNSSSSPRKQSRPHPIFAIFFKCPQKEVDFTFEPRKTEVEFQHRNRVENFIHDSVRKVLEDNFLLVPSAMNEHVSYKLSFWQNIILRPKKHIRL